MMRLASSVIMLIIKLYQAVSRAIFPLPVCRFEPSCSNYAIFAFEKYSAPKAALMVFYRLLRCNPLCKGGYDPLK